MKKDPMIIADQKIPKTVSGYLDLATSTILTTKNLTVDPRTFLFNVSKFNPLCPRNIYLLCGDASIELVARSLEQKRNQHASLSQFGQFAWKSVTCCLKQFIRKIAERKGIKLTVFIDTNSSFSILTEIALAASEKLLLPITDDHLRRRGFEYMFALLYGFSQPSNVYFYYRHYSFYFRALEHDVKLPKIHLILNSYKTTASLSNEAEWEFIYDVYNKHPQAFKSQTDDNSKQVTMQEFKNKFVIDFFAKESTNQIIRQAIRSHSPLNVKQNNLSVTSHSPHIGFTSTNTSPSLLGTPRLSIHRSPSQSPSKSRRKDLGSSLSTEIDNTVSQRYPYQSQRHFTTKPVINNNDLISVNNLSLNDDNIRIMEENDAILFDKLLDKIVDSLKE